jgi:hypothetical protein
MIPNIFWQLILPCLYLGPNYWAIPDATAPNIIENIVIKTSSE